MQPQARLDGELGPQAATELKHQRASAVAQEMRLGAALEAADAAAADLRIPYAVLKGQALVLGGFAPDGGRPSSDLDLLVPEAKLDALQKELLRREFIVAGEAYEHQAPGLRHAGGGMIELHRVLPGVRLEPKRSATFGTLAAAGLLAPPPSAMTLRRRGDLRLPRRELLTAHALVHAIAQHGLAPAVFPGFLFLGDLVDLAFRGSGGRATLAAIVPWIESEVSYEEASAALDLATALADWRRRAARRIGWGSLPRPLAARSLPRRDRQPGLRDGAEAAPARASSVRQAAGGGEGRAAREDAGAASGRVVVRAPALSRPAAVLDSRRRQAKVEHRFSGWRLL